MFLSHLARYPLSKVTLATCFCLTSALLPVAQAAPIDDVKAVFVGHSLINYDMPAMVEQLAASGNGLTMSKTSQIINGSPLKFNWDNCSAANSSLEYPPLAFACDEISTGTVSGPYDTIVMTDANNPIRGHHFYNQTQVYIDRFAELLKQQNPDAKAYFFASWEGLDYHSQEGRNGIWEDEIAGELAEYEQIIAEAKRLALDAGRSPDLELIPSNWALRQLILAIESGQMKGLTSRHDVFSDDVHMNDLGNYFMANVVFAAIYQRTPEGLTHRIVDQYGDQQLLVDPELALQMQSLAWSVVNDYREAMAQPGADNGAPNGHIITPGSHWTVDLGRELVFSAQVSDPDLDSNLSYLWDFDGAAPNQTTLTSSAVVFDQVGVYEVTFTVTDSQGKSDPSPSTNVITVVDPNAQPQNQAPESIISLPNGDITVEVGDSVQFVGQGTDADGDSQLAFLWQFDGVTADRNQADAGVVIFDTVGSFNVSFTVTDSEGLSDATPATVTVSVEAPELAMINNVVINDVVDEARVAVSWSVPVNADDITGYQVLVNEVPSQTVIDGSVNVSLSDLDRSRLNTVVIQGMNAQGEVIAQSEVVNIQPLMPTHGAAPNEKSAIGINLTGPSYWATQWMTIDVMKHASNGSGVLWSTNNALTYEYNTGDQELLDLDEQGWPRSLPAADDANFHHVSTVIFQDNQHYATGEYVVLYDGEGELNYSGVTLLTDKSAPGRDVVRLDANSFFHLQIRKTDPNNTGDYIRNIRILMPGGICGDNPLAYAESADDCQGNGDYHQFERIYRHQTFHPLFLQDLQQYRALRFMQMMQVNVSEQSVWSDRPTYQQASWALNGGVPIEMAIELSNQVQAEPWLNVPARVDDDYMRQYARLVRDNLDANLDVYVELGNEVWNNAYPYIFDAIWMREQGKSRWPDAGVHDFIYRLNYFGKRSSDMCEIFKTEFGSQANRVKCVMGSQGGNAWVGEQILRCELWAAENGGQNCAHNFDSLAIGPYFGGYFHQDKFLPVLSQWADEGATGIDKMFEEINNGILRDLTYDPDGYDWEQAPIGGALAQTKTHIEHNRQLAEQFGLQLTAYEGGQHLTYAGHLADDRAKVNEQLFLASNRDERMGQAFTQHFNDWKQAGGSLYMVFESTARWGSFGAFPLKEYQTQPMANTPKLRHTLDFIEQNPCWWQGCDHITHAKTSVMIDDVVTPPDGGNGGGDNGEPTNSNIALTAVVRPAQWGVALTWTELTGDTDATRVQYYQIYRDGEFAGHTNNGELTINQDWLNLHQAYQFQIQAVNVFGDVIGQSNIVTTMAGDSVASTQVTDLAVSFDGHYGFVLNWTASQDDGGIRHYLIYRNGEPYSHTTELSFADQFPPQGDVSYQVVAVDHVGNQAEGSNVVIGVIPSVGFQLVTTATAASYGITLSWQYQDSQVHAFQIYRDGQFVGHTSADTLSYQMDWLSLGVDYQLQVRAVDEAGNILMLSTTVITQAGDSQVPTQVTGFSVTDDGAYGFVLEWQASTDNSAIDYYKIKRNGEWLTHTQALTFNDQWPPQGNVSYEIYAVDIYHNIAPASQTITVINP